MSKQQDWVEVLKRINDCYWLAPIERTALTAAISALTVDEAVVERALAAWFALPSQTSDQERMRAALTAALAGKAQEESNG